MNDSAKTAKIYLGRHCKTAWNLEGRLIGTTDLPLCDVGWNEAKDTLPIVEKYKFDRIVSSPLKRAFDTSRYYADNLKIPLEVNQDLRELDAVCGTLIDFATIFSFGIVAPNQRWRLPNPKPRPSIAMSPTRTTTAPAATAAGIQSRFDGTAVSGGAWSATASASSARRSMSGAGSPCSRRRASSMYVSIRPPCVGR